MTIGMRIKNRREELNLTQTELAKKIGYTSKTTINKIECGVNQLRQDKIKAMADALDVSIAYLMGWDEEEIEAVDAAHQESLVSTNQARFKEEFGDILFTDEEVEKIIDYIRFVLNSRK